MEQESTPPEEPKAPMSEPKQEKPPEEPVEKPSPKEIYESVMDILDPLPDEGNAQSEDFSNEAEAAIEEAISKNLTDRYARTLKTC